MVNYELQSSVTQMTLFSQRVTAIRQIPHSENCLVSSLSGQIKVIECLAPRNLIYEYSSGRPINNLIYLAEFQQIVTVEAGNTITVSTLNTSKAEAIVKIK